jgi:hypothetical protein
MTVVATAAITPDRAPTRHSGLRALWAWVSVLMSAVMSVSKTVEAAGAAVTLMGGSPVCWGRPARPSPPTRTASTPIDRSPEISSENFSGRPFRRDFAAEVSIADHPVRAGGVRHRSRAPNEESEP